MFIKILVLPKETINFPMNLSAGLLIREYIVWWMRRPVQVSQVPFLSPVATPLEKRGSFLPAYSIQWLDYHEHSRNLTGDCHRSIDSFTSWVNIEEIYLDDPKNIACRIITAHTEEPPKEKPLGELEWQALLNKHTDHFGGWSYM